MISNDRCAKKMGDGREKEMDNAHNLIPILHNLQTSPRFINTEPLRSAHPPIHCIKQGLQIRGIVLEKLGVQKGAQSGAERADAIGAHAWRRQWCGWE